MKICKLLISCSLRCLRRSMTKRTQKRDSIKDNLVCEWYLTVNKLCHDYDGRNGIIECL